jgi:hypothetical protein
MTQITDARSHEVPFLLDDIDIKSLASVDFDPYNSASPTASDKARYLNGGFLVRPNADGDVKVVTWANYKDNDDTVVDANAITIPGCTTGVWELVRVVKVFKTGTTATAVAIGILP